MTDFARHHAKRTKKRRSASAGLVFALAMLVVLIVGAAAFVALVLWPRWPAATVAPDAPALPVTIGGVLFNVPPAAIRIPAQRHSGAQERLDLAFLWPSLAPPDPAAKLAPNEQAPPIDRLFVTIAMQSRCDGAERPRALDLSALSRRNAVRRTGRAEGDLVQGRHAVSGRDLFFDPAAQPGFVARCSRPGAAGTPGMCLYERRIEGADVTVRFPSDWLTQWRAVNEGIGKLIGRLKPGRIPSHISRRSTAPRSRGSSQPINARSD